MTGYREWGTPRSAGTFGPPPADTVNAFHAAADTDASPLAGHHTLGRGATQAAGGGHSHDGADSVRLDPTELSLPAGSAKGDLLVAATSGWVRLARGAEGAVLGADVGSGVTGLRWRPPPGCLCPVRAVSTAGVTVASPGAVTQDGVAWASGNRVLLAAQAAAAENGVYVFNGSGAAMTRAPDAALSAQLPPAVLVGVSEGTLFGGSVWQLATTGAVVLGTTGLSFVPVLTGWVDYSASLAWTGTVTNPAKGNGTLAGRYRLSGKTCTVQVEMEPGTTTTFGSGAWQFSLPFQASAAMDQVLSGFAYDNAPTATGYTLAGRVDASGTTVLRSYSSGGSPADATHPFAWAAAAANDRYSMAGVYETV